ncbi:MAG: CopG family ribbon-helix-helix protein [Candidatus Hermodarchaeota archaeon]
MEEYKRFTVSLPKDLYEKFEAFREKLGISRSDSIRKAMHSLMVSEENIRVKTDNVVGCIPIIMLHEHFIGKHDLSHEHSQEVNHDDEHHNHEYESGPIYANVQQTDEIRKTDIQHHFHDIIISTMHVHLEFEKCLEIIAVSGPYKRVKLLKEKLQRLKSVISIDFFIIDKEFISKD